jgi:hypothetical protein
MKNLKTASFYLIALFSILFVLLVPGLLKADWLQTNSPPDVDKAEHMHGAKPTCWVAAASNMLAGAGYGNGNTIQERADDVYTELCADPNIDCNDYGWADTALKIWLNSNNNTWKQTNPFKIVTVHAYDPDCKINRDPYAKKDLPKFIGNELRKGNKVRLSILRPNKTGGHAITAWGDDGTSADLTENPDKVKVSDSDYWITTEDIQTYTYDDFNNPNPNGSNQGNGWYFNYSYGEDNHRYIDNIVTLSYTSYDMNKVVLGGAKKYIASYKIHQDVNDFNALGLHYKVSSGNILTYRTTINWDNNDISPTISENNDPPTELSVKWDLSENPVPYCNDVTITTEVILQWTWGTEVFNPITYEDVNFGYFALDAFKPGFGWRMTTPLLSSPVEPNATGGYVIGAFDLFTSPNPGSTPPIAQYRFICEYGYDQDPEYHQFYLEANPQPQYYVGNFKFAHSYACLEDDMLWQYPGPWKTYAYDIYSPPLPQLSGTIGPIVNWNNQLPYPKGQDYTSPVPDECGDAGTSYLGGDINRDCKVDFYDFAEFAAYWLDCSDPNNLNCP